MIRRLVRVHCADPHPTVEGILVSRWGGHYRLLQAKLLEAPGRTHDVGEVWVPRERVVLIQRL